MNPPQDDDLSIPVTRSRDASPGTQSSDTPTSFEFVTNDQNRYSQIRRHAMRESWRQRNRGRSQSNSPTTRARGPTPRARRIIPRVLRAREANMGAGQDAEMAESSDVMLGDAASPSDHDHVYSSEDGGSTDSDDKALFTRDGVFIDLRNTMVSTYRTSNRPIEWTLSGIPMSSGQRPSPYQSLGSTDIDPFNNIRLSREDRELLHHWVHTYARQAFGVPTDPVFDPIRNLYVAIDLAQPGAVHASLAHSASHIAYLRREQDSSIQAITHKMAAIQLINQALDDPVKAISDENFSAICRLLTFERYWGTEAAWKLHRKGLVQLIKKRGGLSTFQSNWKLELRVHLISLMPKPSWNKPIFASSPQFEPEPALSHFDVLQDYEIPHSNFVSFFSEITTVSPETSSRYPVITRAIYSLRSEKKPGQDVSRLICLFYIAVIFKHAKRSNYDLSWLNDSLAMTESIWSNSVETLRWLLLQGMGRGPEAPESLARTEKLAEVAGLLKENSWRRLEDRYSKLLLDGTPNGSENAPWNSNIFEDED